MILKEILMSDLKTAMKSKDTVMKNVVTMLRSEIKQYEVDNRVELGNDEIIDIITKQIKQIQGAIEDFKKGDRADLVEEAELEIKLLSKYLPEPLSDDELQDLVKATIEEQNASTMKDMGKVMGILSQKTKGRADGRRISELVRAALK